MLLRVLLVLLAVVNIGFGLIAIVRPRRVAEWIGFAISSPGAYGEMRAVYGGLLAVIGVLILLALHRPEWHSWLLALALGFAGLAVGRLVSLVFDGVAGYTLLALVFEAASAALLWIAARNPPPA